MSQSAVNELNAQDFSEPQANAEFLITEHLDLWASVITSRNATGRGSNKKIELYGIKKLRELILELAVRGKLVSQDPNEEPASELLKRIESEKTQLVEKGKIRKSKALPALREYENKALPAGWVRSRLGQFVYLEMGQSPASQFYNQSGEGLPFFQGKADFGDVYPTARYWCNQPQKYSYPQDVLLSVRAPVGPTNISNVECCIGRGLAALRPLSGVPCFFLHYMMMAYRPYLEEHATGTIFAAVSKVDVDNLVIAVPPLGEQHRIVAKVDELMALCDRLENQTEQSLDAHATLADTLLDALTQAQSAEELAENWQRLEKNWDLLFPSSIAGERAIDKLKQTILQLAVTGKLVPQDPNDEPASELLKRIAVEKKQLVKERRFQKTGKLQAKHHLSRPKGWADVQIGQVCLSVVPSRDKPKSFTGGIPWVTLPDFPKESLYLNDEAVKKRISELERLNSCARIIPAGSVLMSCVGRFGLTAINRVSVTTNQQVHGFVPLGNVSPEYLSVVIKSYVAVLEEMSTSTTVAYLNKSKCESIQFGLPPLMEQSRIVDKAYELIALCGQLTQRLQAVRETQKHFADSIVKMATS